MKREAQKIVEAQLNDALDRNDSKAIREACIVLKALDISKDEFKNYEKEFDTIKKGLEAGENERTIVPKLINEFNLSEEEAFKLYWDVRKSVDDAKWDAKKAIDDAKKAVDDIDNTEK